MSFTVYAQLTPAHARLEDGVHSCRNEAAARREGHPVIHHPGGAKFEEVVVEETLTRESRYRRVSIRNHTAGELQLIRRVLERLPGVVLNRFADQYTGIVCVDWTGQPWFQRGQGPARPGAHTLLTGGSNISGSRTRNGITESGLRIELTHSAMYEYRQPPHDRRGVFTLWHELGHFAYRNGFTPRSVERSDYGTSICTGREEQPAYAFMWYFLNPRRLTLNDRAAFDRIFERLQRDPRAEEPDEEPSGEGAVAVGA